MTNEEFIQQHRQDNIQTLALGHMPDGIDPKWCLQQIGGWQLAKDKLPHWAGIGGLWYPPRISMEQCSGELTAVYKRQVAERLMPEAGQRAVMVDLTGGYGVDFSYMASAFARSVYVERQEHLCDIARHNFELLGLNAEIVCGDSANGLPESDMRASLIYIDPARRDNAGRKTVAIEDCTPDVSTLLPRLLAQSDFVMIKLSPMLDISMALRALPSVCEVHVVSVRGECKELLLICSADKRGLEYHCANLGTDEAPVVIAEDRAGTKAATAEIEDGMFLYEPNASILKAGVQDAVADTYGLRKIHPISNLFTSREIIGHFPGRTFRIISHSDFNKRNLKNLLTDITQANITIRNFPSTVAELRKRLKLKEGGNTYLFATTLSDNSHAILRCEKAGR